jgi:hypothetical protein
MPRRSTAQRANNDLRDGKSPSTAAGEFVHEEVEHVRKGKHGARSPQQAIAIGLSKARRAGVPLPPPRNGRVKESTRKDASRAYAKGQSGNAEEASPRSSRTRKKAMEREPHSSTSHRALSAQTRRASRELGSRRRHQAAAKAAQTKGRRGRQAAAGKAARTRARHA